MQPKANVGKASLLNTVARIISKVINPFGVSIIALLSATYVGSSSLPAFFKRVSIILCFTVVLPLAYTYVRSPRFGIGAKRILDPLLFFKVH